MTVARETEAFPTRNYPYGAAQALGNLPPGTVPPAAPSPDTLYRRVMGLDTVPRPMTDAEKAQLNDPFGRLLRSEVPFPLTLRDLLAALDRRTGDDALPEQLVFLAADGGHIPWTPQNDALRRAPRFAVARGIGNGFTLLASSSTRVDSAADEAFLQVIGWDDVAEVFHYYERRLGTWFWAGMSPHALHAPTRGQGPFDSHVNGSLVMKELRPPWIHWHAPLAGINQDAFAPQDPLPNDPIFHARVTAERLESQVVRPGIRRWNRARVTRTAVAGTWHDVPAFLRQVITDTTVNLASSETASALLEDDTPLRPPLSFFLNRDILLDTLGLELTDPAATLVEISGKHYRDCLSRYDVHRSDGAIRVDGDVHFAFLTPEPAFEDTDLAAQLLASGLLTERLLLALSMTDFANPVFSSRRARLLHHVPTNIQTGGDAGQALETMFVKAINAAVDANAVGAGSPGSAEREFLVLWSMPDLRQASIQRLDDYFRALKSRAGEPQIVDGWFQLAEYRRRRFRERRLFEFKLTTPRTNIPDDAPPLQMTPAGVIAPI